MNKERELLGRAKNNLAKLCSVNSMSSRGEMLRLIDEAIKGIDEFLASEPEDEPVAWVDVKETDQGPYEFHGIKLLPVGKHNLYTRPAQERKPMTKEEIDKRCSLDWFYGSFVEGIRSAEQHHGIGGES